MCQDRSNHSHQHSHCEEHHHHHHHHHDLSEEPGSALSSRQKLIVRLEHSLRHNSEHADFYDKLAVEAGSLEGEAVVQEIRAAAVCTARLNEHLEKALSLIKAR